jgi:asparagine synthase (glutamine-hydrolysing)
VCGICGIVDTAGRRLIDHRRLARMSQLLTHRGPDGDGIYIAPGVGLGHRRLAIIDIEGGRQPLFNETGRIAVVFNGEIYNFRELATDLARRGHRMATRSDTEVIVHAWEEWGETCVERFNGMFAFALWDADRESLFLARDRVGEKPLYYTRTPDGLVLFASELGALVAALPERPSLDCEAIEDYFAYGYVPDPKTIHRGISKLSPGHTLRFERGMPAPAPRCYWDVHFEEQCGSDEPEAELAFRLQTAVTMRMISEVPLGAFLSGGLDSSSVVSFMANASPHPVKTCSIGFQDAAADESGYARLVAEQHRTDHYTEIVEPDACALLDRLAAIYGEPFADSSALPTYLLSGLARRRVTVALSGDGGDEVFAGYPRYIAHLWEEKAKRIMSEPMRRAAFGSLASFYPKLDWAPQIFRMKATFEALAADEIGGYFRAVTILPEPLRQRIYSGDFTAALGGYNAIEVLRGHAAHSGTQDPVATAQYLDLKTVLPGGMLVKVDRASMAHSLEVRAPFLDHTLVEWAAGLPRRQKVRGMSGKHLLKRAMRQRLPPEIIGRPKQGFSPPVAAWLRNDLAGRLRDVVRDAPLAESGLFSPSHLREMADHHIAGFADHSRALWALLLFDAFLRLPQKSSSDDKASLPPSMAASTIPLEVAGAGNTSNRGLYAG